MRIIVIKYLNLMYFYIKCVSYLWLSGSDLLNRIYMSLDIIKKNTRAYTDIFYKYY